MTTSQAIIFLAGAISGASLYYLAWAISEYLRQGARPPVGTVRIEAPKEMEKWLEEMGITFIKDTPRSQEDS